MKSLFIRKPMKERDRTCCDHPVKNKGKKSRKKFEKHLDVRYMRNIRGKFSNACSQQICPVMRDRLDQHQMEHHDKDSKCCCKRSKSINLAVPIMTFHEDLIVTPIVNPNCKSDALADENVTNDDESQANYVPIKATETIEILTPKINFYKEYIHNEVFKWLHDVPLYPNNSSSDELETAKMKVVNDLVEDIVKLSNDIKHENYDNNVKLAADNCLEKLSMWYPGAKRNQNLFKVGLREDLLNKIKELNNKHLNNQSKSDIVEKNIDENSENGSNADDNEVNERNINAVTVIQISGNESNKNVNDALSNKTATEVNNTLSKNRITDSMENEITEWLAGIKLIDDDNHTTKETIVKLLLHNLLPILDEPMNTTSQKLIMKGEIVGILDDLPIWINNPKNKLVHLNRYAEDLANRLLSIKCKYRRHSFIYNLQTDQQKSYELFALDTTDSFFLRHNLNDKLKDCLDVLNIQEKDILRGDIAGLLVDNLNLIRSGYENTIEDEITELIYDTCNLTEAESSNAAEYILKSVRDIMKRQITTKTVINPQLSGIISVYTSESGPITSTPKRKKNKKEIPKLSPEETNYTSKVAEVVRTWIKTLPEGNRGPDDKDFTELAVSDLSGNIMDARKLNQLIPQSNEEQEKNLQFITSVWVLKFSLFDDANAAKPYIQDFCNKLNKIPVPDLTKPYHGSRHAAKNIEYGHNYGGPFEFFPEKADVIEDQISIWLNEQPSEIYVTKDNKAREKMIHEVAEKVVVQLRNQKQQNKVRSTVSQFLKKVVKPKTKGEIEELSESLFERLIKPPDEQELDYKRKLEDIRILEMEEKLMNECCKIYGRNKPAQDTDGAVKEFIFKFIEHRYDIEDSVARGAFARLLERELFKLDAATRKEVYENFEHEQFSPQKLNKELVYINVVSDWLKNIPVKDTFNEVGNEERKNFVIDLAQQINVVEDAKCCNANDDNHDENLVMTIYNFANKLPLKQGQEQNINYMIGQLCKRVRNASQNCHLISFRINEDNIGDFIEDYIEIRAKEIAYDEVKLEAWIARIMKEVRRIARQNPNALTKAQVYKRLENVPIPTDESIKRFDLELGYVTEISEWLRNLPLLPVQDEFDEQVRIDKVSDLAEKLADRAMAKQSNAAISEEDIHDYITRWIMDLPLDSNREVVVPIVIQQLMNRTDHVGKTDNVGKTVNFNKSHEKNSISKHDFTKKSPIKNKKSTSKTKQGRGNQSNPGKIIVDAIEKFSKSLPIEGDEKMVENIRNNISKRLFQKISEINTDPTKYDDGSAYTEYLAGEIERALENIPQSDKNRDKLKSDLLTTILDARELIKEKYAGDNYVHNLINTLDISIPDPVDNTRNYDPGFELYKNKLANMFILDNFDHGNDAVKLKYEKIIRKQIDKYFISAARRNAIPLTKDQIYNELYSALFKVKIPNEVAVKDEVEQVKMRCEIDGWFEQLPLREPDGLSELLEWDEILATLTKRIHELEKEDEADEKIRKEIEKWLFKLPFSPGYDCSRDSWVKKLISRLKSTAEDRKCVPKDFNSKKNKGKKSKINIQRTSPESGHAGPSSASKKWATPSTSPERPTPCCQTAPTSEKKPAELILETITNWFKSLPLGWEGGTYANSEIIREDAVTKMIVKISEFIGDPNIFNDDAIYYELINDELEKILSDLPLRCDFKINKDIKKLEFFEGLQMIKPFIKEEIVRYEYKKNLMYTVDKVLEHPEPDEEDKAVLFNKFKDELVEEFVQYYYNKEDEEGRQIYKYQVHDTLLRYIQEVLNNKEKLDPLMLRNKLICELEKIPISSETVVMREVQEIKMKEEVAAFLDENSLPIQNKLQEQVRLSLAKKLYDMERSGYTCDNKIKMKEEIKKSLKKFGAELSKAIIEEFVEKLKETESQRKAPPPRREVHHQTLNQSNLISRSHPQFGPINQGSSPVRHDQSQYSSQRFPGGCRLVNDGRRFKDTPPTFASQGSAFPSFGTGNVSGACQSSVVSSPYGRSQVQHDINIYGGSQKLPSTGHWHTVVPNFPERMQRSGLSTSLPYSTVPSRPFLSQSLDPMQLYPPGGEDQHSQRTCGTVNLSSETCGRPCSRRISPDQADPCNRGSALSCGRNLQQHLHASEWANASNLPPSRPNEQMNAAPYCGSNAQSNNTLPSMGQGQSPVNTNLCRQPSFSQGQYPVNVNPCGQPSMSQVQSLVNVNPCGQPSLNQGQSPVNVNPCGQPYMGQGQPSVITNPCGQPSLNQGQSSVNIDPCGQPSVDQGQSSIIANPCEQPSLSQGQTPVNVHSCGQPSMGQGQSLLYANPYRQNQSIKSQVNTSIHQSLQADIRTIGPNQFGGNIVNAPCCSSSAQMLANNLGPNNSPWVTPSQNNQPPRSQSNTALPQVTACTLNPPPTSSQSQNRANVCNQPTSANISIQTCGQLIPQTEKGVQNSLNRLQPRGPFAQSLRSTGQSDAVVSDNRLPCSQQLPSVNTESNQAQNLAPPSRNICGQAVPSIDPGKQQLPPPGGEGSRRGRNPPSRCLRNRATRDDREMLKVDERDRITPQFSNEGICKCGRRRRHPLCMRRSICDFDDFDACFRFPRCFYD